MQADRRRPYKQLNPKLIESFLGSRSLVSTELLTNSKSSTNYKFVASDGTAYVLRLADGTQLAKEKFVMELVADLVPVPNCFKTDKGYSIHAFVSGKPLSDCPECTYEAARILAKICSVKFPSPGQITPLGKIEPWPFNEAHGFFNLMLKHEKVLSWIGGQRAARIKEVLSLNSSLFSEMAKISNLVHGDFNPSNIMIENGKVSAVLDWEFALSGNTYMDIGNLLRHTEAPFHEDIKAGLIDGGIELPADWLYKARLVDLSSQLEFLNTTRSDKFKRSCVDKIDEYLNFLELK
jgi:aminoglycoside phosphotransferase (APT) family kinase protein